jgi:hypothetical protein
MRTKLKRFLVSGYDDGERFGEAGYHAENERSVTAKDAEDAEFRVGEIWGSHGIRPQLIVAVELTPWRIRR